MGRLKAVLIAACALAAIVVPSSSASTAYTCTGGSVPAGTYSTLTIAGTCAINAGTVRVEQGASILPNATLFAAFGGSDLKVHQDLHVGRNAILVLGCEPQAFPCFNDNQEHPTMSTNDEIGGNLTAEGAFTIIVHLTQIGMNIVQTGGGGGLTCESRSRLMGSPAYFTYEDNRVGGSVWLTGWQSCWAGFIRNTVRGSVNYNNNVTADPDGNEIVTNTITGDLNCSGNSPKPQLGDSGGSLNVAHRGTGQCDGLVAH